MENTQHLQNKLFHILLFKVRKNEAERFSLSKVVKVDPLHVFLPHSEKGKVTGGGHTGAGNAALFQDFKSLLSVLGIQILVGG